jgi:hypothetical protein
MRSLFFIFFFQTVFQLSVYSQQWAPTGCVWHYGMIESYFAGDQGYLRVESIGDTVIHGQQCKILHKTRYDAYWHTLTDEGNDYMYSSNDVVYHFMNDTFYTVYDFNAMPGDTWTVAVPSPSPWFSTDTLVKIIVDSVSTITIQNQILKSLYVHSDSNEWRFLNPIIERIGSMGGMFPFIYGFMDMDIPFFRCYADTSIFYNRNPSQPCDTVIDDLPEFPEASDFSIYPNPSSGNWHIKVPVSSMYLHRTFIRVYNAYGQLILSREIKFENNNGVPIDAHDFKPGIYEVQLATENQGMRGRRKLIIAD